MVLRKDLERFVHSTALGLERLKLWRTQRDLCIQFGLGDIVNIHARKSRCIRGGLSSNPKCLGLVPERPDEESKDRHFPGVPLLF